MRKLLLLTLIVSANAISAPKQIVCSITATAEKAKVLSKYEPNLQAGDVWRADTYKFDTSDFDKDIKTGTYYSWNIVNGTETREMEYTVSSDWLGFNSDGKYPSSHRISRKTLKYQTSAMNNYAKCILEDVDTSENLL